MAQNIMVQKHGFFLCVMFYFLSLAENGFVIFYHFYPNIVDQKINFLLFVCLFH
jgi:hypothetical protein